LFNRTNSYELVGKTSIFKLEETFVFASYLVRIIPDFDKIFPEYLNYYLNWGETQARLKLLASRGVSQSNINATKLRDFSIPFPSLSIQKQIAIILNAIDQKLAAEQSRKETLNLMFASLLHNLMTAKTRVKNIV
jgi:type I restriction enzyme S subunit